MFHNKIICKKKDRNTTKISFLTVACNYWPSEHHMLSVAMVTNDLPPTLASVVGSVGWQDKSLM